MRRWSQGSLNDQARMGLRRSPGYPASRPSNRSRRERSYTTGEGNPEQMSAFFAEPGRITRCSSSDAPSQQTSEGVARRHPRRKAEPDDPGAEGDQCSRSEATRRRRDEVESQPEKISRAGWYLLKQNLRSNWVLRLSRYV